MLDDTGIPSPHTVVLNGRPQFNTTGDPNPQFPLKYFLKSHKVGSFINSGDSPNVEAVLVDGVHGRYVVCVCRPRLVIGR